QMSPRERHKAEIRKKSVSAYLGIEQGMPLKAFKALIESGGCPNFTPEWMESFSLIVFLFGGSGAKPMAFQALHHQRTDIFDYLLHHSQFDPMNKYNRFSLIHYAVYVKNTEAVRQLLLTQPDIDRELFPEHRNVSLIKRVLDAGPEILQVFLERKVFLPDAVFSKGWGFSTPLLHCSENNTEMHTACAKLLFLHGAKPNLMMRHESILPLVKAYKAGNTQLMSLLLSHNANVEWVDSSGMSFIGRLISDGQWTLIQKLELIESCRKVLAQHIQGHILDETGSGIVSQLVTNDDWYLIEQLGMYPVCRNYWLRSREVDPAESSFAGGSRWCILL
ncbi:MAG: ankyrin repeat domain-containing protein, partial [Endozoicomonas sp.]